MLGAVDGAAQVVLVARQDAAVVVGEDAAVPGAHAGFLMLQPGFSVLEAGGLVGRQGAAAHALGDAGLLGGLALLHRLGEGRGGEGGHGGRHGGEGGEA
jgi:hypothetical protein